MLMRVLKLLAAVVVVVAMFEVPACGAEWGSIKGRILLDGARRSLRRWWLIRINSASIRSRRTKQ